MWICLDLASSVCGKLLTYERTRQRKDVVRLSPSLVSPLAWIIKGHSPCLSFNSIFTPCQIHLGAFHHHWSPSAIFPPLYLSSLLMFDERHNGGDGGGARGEGWGVFYLCHGCFFHFTLDWCLEHLPTSLPPQGVLPFPGLPFSFPSR